MILVPDMADHVVNATCVLHKFFTEQGNQLWEKGSEIGKCNEYKCFTRLTLDTEPMYIHDYFKAYFSSAVGSVP